MRGNRKDDNHRAIVAALERVGALCIDMTGDPSIGFDLLVIFRAMVDIAEIKDGDKPERARRLTKGEQKRKVEIERRGGVYRIFLSPEDALRQIGAIR